MSSKPILEVEKLNVRYQTKDGDIHAVEDVSFKVFSNEVFGIAGESGCGKSCLLYTSPSPRDAHESRMPSSA